MKRIICLMLVFAMLLPNLTVAAGAVTEETVPETVTEGPSLEATETVVSEETVFDNTEEPEETTVETEAVTQATSEATEAVETTEATEETAAAETVTEETVIPETEAVVEETEETAAATEDTVPATEETVAQPPVETEPVEEEMESTETAEGTASNDAQNIVGEQGDTYWSLNEVSGLLTIYCFGDMAEYPGWLKYSDQIVNVVIKNGATNISGRAFSFCENLTSVKIPSTVTNIEEEAFIGCSSLKNLKLPSSVTSIGLYAFGFCISLEDVEIPQGVTVIEQGAFEGCTGLKNVEIPDSVTRIDEHVFDSCESLTTVTIPSSVQYIGGYAFYRCTNLKEIYFLGDKCRTGYYLFKNTENAVAYYPSDNTTWTEGYFAGIPCKPYCYGEHTVVQGDFVDSTCSEVGYTAGPYCALCGERFEGRDIVEKKPHTEEIIPAVAPTCTETGLAEGKKCSVCGEVTVPQEQVAKAPHTEEIIPAVESTCSRQGLTEGKKCSVCGKVTLYQQKTQYKPHTVEIIPAVESTCSKTGSTEGEKCSVCESWLTYPDEVDKKPHTEETIPGADPTCTETGLTDGKKCSVCGEVTLAQETIPANGHSEETVPGKEPTCTETGLTDGKICTVCDAVTLAQETIPATGKHTYERGWCTVCGGEDPKFVLEPKISAGTVASSGKPQLTWTVVEEAVKYEIWRATSEYGTYSRIWTQKETTYVNKNAVAGTRYYYKVKAVDANGNRSGFSNCVSRVCDLPVPTNVEATNDAASGKVKLSWNKVSGAAGYKVYRATSKNGTYKLMKTVTERTYINTSAKAGTKYYYKVRAVHSNTDANSAYSAVVSRMCDCKQPTLQIANSSVSSIKLSWNSISGAQKYTVYRATSRSGNYSKLGTVSGTSYTDKKITAGKTYYYKLVANGAQSSANSVASEILSVKAALMAPKIKTTANVTKKSIKISWNPVKGATGYYVYRKSYSGSSWTRIATVKSGTSYKDAVSGCYYYSVAAFNKVNGKQYVSLKSQTIQVRTLAAPSYVSVDTVNGTMMNTVSWGTVSGATGYQVYYKTGEGTSWTRLDTVSGTSSYTHYVDRGVWYYYKVRPIYKNAGVTSYGPYKEETKGTLHYFEPQISIFMSSKAVASTNSAVIMVTNKGSGPVRFYSDGIWMDWNYSSFDRSVVLQDPDNGFAAVEYVEIPAGGSEILFVHAVGRKTWYDKYTTIYLDMYYDGLMYTTSSSAYFGFSCSPKE